MIGFLYSLIVSSSMGVPCRGIFNPTQGKVIPIPLIAFSVFRLRVAYNPFPVEPDKLFTFWHIRRAGHQHPPRSVVYGGFRN
jgi:hypothetical protein